MEILWLAILVYSIGLAAVLQFRPSMMFREDGTWKEFGYQRVGPSGRHTIFPFWLFAITWAIVSYAIAAAVTWTIAAGPGAAAIAATAATNFLRVSSSSEPEYESEADEEDEKEVEVMMEPVSKVRTSNAKRSKLRPGYYVIDPEAAAEGLRKYIYYGTKAPSE